ncbi:MAG: hypothetical protein RSH79_07220 [Clostridiales bacterium]
MTIQNLEKQIQELKELQLMAEELGEEITTIQDIIKTEMTARNTEEIIAGSFKVRWKEVVSHRFDSKSFKATHADLYTQYSKETISRRFTVA